MEAFCVDYGNPDAVTFQRVAVTEDQIDEFDLEPAPPKANDHRGETMTRTVKAEALTPEQLANTLADALDRVVDTARGSVPASIKAVTGGCNIPCARGPGTTTSAASGSVCLVLQRHIGDAALAVAARVIGTVWD